MKKMAKKVKKDEFLEMRGRAEQAGIPQLSQGQLHSTLLRMSLRGPKGRGNLLHYE